MAVCSTADLKCKPTRRATALGRRINDAVAAATVDNGDDDVAAMTDAVDEDEDDHGHCGDRLRS